MARKRLVSSDDTRVGKGLNRLACAGDYRAPWVHALRTPGASVEATHSGWPSSGSDESDSLADIPQSRGCDSGMALVGPPRRWYAWASREMAMARQAPPQAYLELHGFGKAMKERMTVRLFRTVVTCHECDEKLA